MSLSETHLQQGHGFGKNGIRVFPHLPIKIRIADGTLGLLEKLSISATIKKLAGYGHGLLQLTSCQGLLDQVGFTFHFIHSIPAQPSSKLKRTES